MSPDTRRRPQRDMNISAFGEILRDFCSNFPDVETAVIHDSTGETIDYFAYVDPYQARLVAAHFGLVFRITSSKLQWLGLGGAETIEIVAAKKNCRTVRLDDDLYLTLMMTGKISENEFNTSLKQVVSALKEEAGV